MLALIFLAALAVFAAAYRFLGRGRLTALFGLDDDVPTPAVAKADGIDYVAARPAVLFGHHFSSIAGAGPIVGPVIVGLAFGWLPALLWIVAGTVLIGGVHDLGAIAASLRHEGRSIAEVANHYISPLSHRLFLLFIWLTLVYVLVVFANLTSTTFVESGAVATSSVLYILLAVLFGVCLYRLNVGLVPASLVFVPLVFAAIWAGIEFPLTAPALFGSQENTWTVVLLAYVFLASTLPVWLLLQPRDYLSSFLLYSSVLAGVAGILFGGFDIRYPAFTGFHSDYLGPLLPVIFITIACGAVSGFHALVGSGTTSKQLSRQSDAVVVGYGGMMTEGLVAVIALATVMVLAAGSPETKGQPMAVYADGLSRFCGVLGVSPEVGRTFGLLALSSFILTTLDTATRLGRYIFQEFTGLSHPRHRWTATLATLAMPAFFLFVTLQGPNGQPMPAWKAVWPLFGTTNQLLAALVLLVLTVWLMRLGKNYLWTLLPMAFMMTMTVWSLIQLILAYKLTLIGLIAAALFGLTVLIVAETLRSLLSGVRPV
ncbi:MAG: carbon starvation protein A [Elusimicrobiota bacterium]|jgi:carbon starvation protein